MGALLGFFSSPSRIAAGVLAVLCALLLTWALVERSGRLSAKVELVTLKAQTDVLADSLKRCNEGVERAAAAGQAATAETKRLLALVERGLERTAALRDEARSIVSKPTPVRADGKPKDCGDALTEIRAKVRP